MQKNNHDTNNNNDNDNRSCDVRIHAYKNGKAMEQCKEEARRNNQPQEKFQRKEKFHGQGY